jgi:hypothetical protein
MLFDTMDHLSALTNNPYCTLTPNFFDVVR